jgi:hypothetical protein
MPAGSAFEIAQTIFWLLSEESGFSTSGLPDLVDGQDHVKNLQQHTALTPSD